MKRILLITFLLLIIKSANAQWDGNPATVDNPVTTTNTDGNGVYTVTDGIGGVIAAWTANDGNGNNYLYTQRKTSIGLVAWGDSANPTQLYVTTGYLYIDDLIPDGAGGAYVAWEDNSLDTETLSNTYIQHINTSGTTLLAANGLRVNLADNDYNWFIKLEADASGVITSWTDEHDDPVLDTLINAQVYVQRFNNAGIAQWASGGVQVCTASGFRADNTIISDGNNGAFIVFADSRNSTENSDGDFPNIDIYAQHISSSGTRLWTNNGAVVCNQTSDQDMVDYVGNIHALEPDGAGGLIAAFLTYTDTTYTGSNFYVQRLNENGVMLWAATGVPIATINTTSKDFNAMVSDSAGGTVILWDEQNTLGEDSATHIQRILTGGTLDWGANGQTVTYGTQSYYGSTMDADGAGNYIVNWSVTGSVNNFAIILGQKYNSSGATQWAANGVNICTNPSADPESPYIAKSDSSDMIVVWQDFRNSNVTNIYAAKIMSSGSLVNSYAYVTDADGNWNNPATWIGDVVPPAGVDVIVKNNVIGNLTTTCNSLTVESPGSLHVNAGIKITVLH